MHGPDLYLAFLTGGLLVLGVGGARDSLDLPCNVTRAHVVLGKGSYLARLSKGSVIHERLGATVLVG